MQSDGDVYIERLVDLIEGDTNRDRYIDFDQNDALDQLDEFGTKARGVIAPFNH